MDFIWQEELHNEMLWFDLPPPQPQVNQSTFIRYIRSKAEGLPSENSIFIPRNSKNIHKRMINFLRTIPTAKNENRELENDVCHRHMMNERLRREKQGQSYAALRSMLPPKTKKDKNSILQMVALHLQELKTEKEELQRRNHEIETMLAGNESKKIRLRVGNPSSAVDSMIEVLKFLEDMNFKARTIKSKFSSHELSAVIEVETLNEAAEVKKAVQKILMKVEGKFLLDFLEG
ncbi:hypothetical protein NE237_014862 [Protea cynaroides]|uniref:BHLH domain-containing protein n=1 Tax=Protea cynaroides TaxID=273540 RepID=A0A9Q0KD58_9MAGN|nr:hypothetical protein NE237_014862 [Protea cynaroides]